MNTLFNWVVVEKKQNFDIEYRVMLKSLKDGKIKDWVIGTNVYKDKEFIEKLIINQEWIDYNIEDLEFVKNVLSNDDIFNVLINANLKRCLRIYDYYTEEYKNKIKNYVNGQNFNHMFKKGIDFDFFKKIGINCGDKIMEDDFIVNLSDCDDYVILSSVREIMCFFRDKPIEYIKKWFLNQFKSKVSGKIGFIVKEFFDYSNNNIIKDLILKDKDVLALLVKNGHTKLINNNIFKEIIKDEDLLNISLDLDKYFSVNKEYLLSKHFQENEDFVLTKTMEKYGHLTEEQFKKIRSKVDKQILYAWYLQRVEYEGHYPKKYINKEFIINLNKLNVINKRWFYNEKFVKEFNNLSREDMFNILKNRSELLDSKYVKNISKEMCEELLKEYGKNNKNLYDNSFFITDKKIVIETFENGYGKNIIKDIPIDFWYDIDIVKKIYNEIKNNKISVKELLEIKSLHNDIINFLEYIKNKDLIDINLEFAKIIMDNELSIKKETKKLKI